MIGEYVTSRIISTRGFSPLSLGSNCHLIVGRRMELDTVYAERLKDIKGMHLHYVDSGHNSAQFLRDAGLLSDVLNRFVTGAPLKIG